MSTNEKNITRGGEFIIKETECENVFSPEDFSEEQLMMKQAVSDFIDKEVMPHRERFENKDYKLTEDIMKKAGDLGFLGVAVPEEYGGMGMGFVSTMLVCETISGAVGSLSTAFGAHTGIGTMPIVLYGNKEQNKKFVPKLASGEIFGSYCLTEPSAGSDANSGKTKAVLSEDGTHYKITGQKMWISNAGFAKLFIVFARIEDDKNITGFIVPNESDNGITLGDEEKKLGIHSSSTRQVFFNETNVPVENMLSERGSGFKIAVNSLNVGRIKLAAACLDAQKRVTSYAVQYANERIQFNTKIIDFEAIKEKIATMATDTYVGESATYRAAKDIEDRIKIRHESGNSFQESELKGVEEYAIECSLLKVAISEDMQNIADEGIQVFGGMGFSAETPMEGAWRDCRIGRIYEGTNEINRMLSVGMLIKKAMKGHIDFINPATKVADELMGIPSFEVPDLTKLFAQEKLILKNLKKVFLMLAGAGIKKFGEKLEEHQQMLLAVSDILIEIYMTESALLRTEKNCNRLGTETQTNQIAMTQLYLYKAVDIIQSKGKEVIVSFASGDEQKGLLMGLKRFTKYYEYPNVIKLKNSIADKLKEENKYCF
ncbi:MAG: acyl-CoA dehydrogenase family protein [Flavobacteriaceae bacterium]|nr:acyl-CoA dehydrogenase family protein [Flavobacteriaceae bacterium]MDG1792322.1 acyl-CoA dehydrogenase family protein [Flavobacteriaceae bacterium]MDG2485215.1 acyl-CoA dehydrogenase family protein [Flavobacteriaceae bacterium]